MLLPVFWGRPPRSALKNPAIPTSRKPTLPEISRADGIVSFSKRPASPHPQLPGISGDANAHIPVEQAAQIGGGRMDMAAHIREGDRGAAAFFEEADGLPGDGADEAVLRGRCSAIPHEGTGRPAQPLNADVAGKTFSIPPPSPDHRWYCSDGPAV